MNPVEERLRERLEGGRILSFAHFMEEALYGPDGYYRQPSSPVGRGGDFVTGSSFSPLFGLTTARLLARLDGQLARPAEMLEVGCGDGRHLATVANACPGRTLTGIDRVPRELPAGLRAQESLETVPPLSVEGLIFSYELFDALPVHRVIASEDGPLRELGVELDTEGRFAWKEMTLTDPRLAEQLVSSGVVLQPRQIADLTPAWGTLYGQLASRLRRGLLVTFDYGYRRERLFDPRIRSHGTLACYRRHHVHRDPFREVGRQDLTAHVDFSTLIEAGESQGLRTDTLTRQAPWLTACGLFDELVDANPATRLEARTLLDGEGMGQDLRVLVQSREVDADTLWDRRIC